MNYLSLTRTCINVTIEPLINYYFSLNRINWRPLCRCFQLLGPIKGWEVVVGGGGELRCMIFSIFIILCKGFLLTRERTFLVVRNHSNKKRHREERLLWLKPGTYTCMEIFLKQVLVKAYHNTSTETVWQHNKCTIRLWLLALKRPNAYEKCYWQLNTTELLNGFSYLKR